MARVYPPMPKAENWLAGHGPAFSADSLAYLENLLPLGDVVRLRFFVFNAFVVHHPAAIHQVLVENADKYYKTNNLKKVMYPVLGEGLFTNDGEFWKSQRRLVQPAFHTKRIGAYVETMRDYSLRLSQRWQSGATYDIDHEMTQLTMEIISKTLFDADVSDDAQNVGEAITTVLSDVNKRLDHVVPPPYWIPNERNRRFKQALARMNETIQGFIDARRASGEDKGDLLSMLLMAQHEDGERMTDRQVRDEAMTLFGAGHETTANALTWTWYLLSQHPDVQARLHEELDSVLGGRPLTLDDLPKLTYTEQVIKESMRLFPPAFVVTRSAIDNTEVGGFEVKKGEIVIVSIWGMHRNPNFFPEPHRFDPERFSPENEKALPKYAYLPFGGGPRVCIGNAFAMMEAKVALASIAQHYTLDLAPGHQVEPVRMFTLRPKYGMKMRVSAREPVLA